MPGLLCECMGMLVLLTHFDTTAEINTLIGILAGMRPIMAVVGFSANNQAENECNLRFSQLG